MSESPSPAKSKEATELQKVSFRRILIATDFSEASGKAMSYAMALAHRYGAELFVVHADPEELRTAVPLDALPLELDRQGLESLAQMKALEKTDSHGITRHFALEKGQVWDVLSSVIYGQEIDLLVLGTHGRGGLKKLILGSVAEEVLRAAPCPVLTIGSKVLPLPSPLAGLSRILFATDFGPASTRALPYAVSLAEEYGAQLVLLHVVPPMPVPVLPSEAYFPADDSPMDLIAWERLAIKEATIKLNQLLPSGTKLAHEPEHVVTSDFLPESILGDSPELKCDLIVMGANASRSPALAAHLPGSVVHEVICHAPCPVLTVRE
ncbi:MAG: universal stress protein [Terriglobales bacterium]|jgi:nucleotide-binding universal stress UspA family protein